MQSIGRINFIVASDTGDGARMGGGRIREIRVGRHADGRLAQLPLGHQLKRWTRYESRAMTSARSTSGLRDHSRLYGSNPALPRRRVGLRCALWNIDSADFGLMPLSKISILQIGDVHFPEWEPGTNSVDMKVSDFSPTIESSLRSSPLATILSEIRRVCRFEKPNAVILMGDFTTRGEVDLIENAVTVINGIVNDSFCDKRIPVFGVPGNHDVSKEDAVRLGDLGKFKHVQDAFAKAGWRQIPVQSSVRHVIESHDGCKVIGYFLNSSIGSWSKALYPEGLRSSIFETTADSPPITLADPRPFNDAGLTKPANVSSILAQVYEQIDTPYFRADDLDSVAGNLSQTGSLGLVISHHNVLPQYVPRISYFGELLNSGYARQLFLQSGVDVLYLHGHIHDDPIEIVQSTELNGGRIICVSAPTITAGFNKISIFFTEDKKPFLLKITMHRLERSGVVASGARQVSRLIPLISTPSILLKKDVGRLWRYLNEEIAASDRRIFSWDELSEHASSLGMTATDLEPAILALQCAGLIEIRNFSEAFETWRIETRGHAK